MAKLSPVFNWAEFINGIPASGAKVFTYAAGSSTKQNTFTDEDGLTANPNPIILDARGEPPNDIWLTEGQSYKFVFTASTDTDPPTSPIRTIDDVTGVGDSSVTLSQWVDSGVTPTYVSATQFTVLGDQTSAFHVNRRIKATVTAGTVYGYISASVFGALTTVTVVLDSGNLDTGLSAVQLGLVTATNTSIPQIPLWVTTAMLQNDSVVARTLADSALGFRLLNGTITASVAANALTIAVKTNAGTDPSATDPVIAIFRNAADATGDYTVLSITAATSLVISSGSTLGTVSAQANRIYVVGINDAGTFRLGAYNSYNDTSGTLLALDESLRYFSTAEGGAGAADSAQIIYSGTAVTLKPISILGYVDSTQATAGTWATSPSKVQQMSLGVKITGDIIQTVITSTGAVATGTTQIPRDDTIPQNTEGNQYMSQAITPRAAANLLWVESEAMLSNGAATYMMIGAMFRGSGANAIAAVEGLSDVSARSVKLRLAVQEIANTASSLTYSFRAGANAAGTTTFNGTAGARLYGGVANSFMRITEVAV